MLVQLLVKFQNFNQNAHKNSRTGAILAIGRGGRETTLWTEQKELFDKKFALFFQLAQQFRRNFVQYAAYKIL